MTQSWHALAARFWPPLQVVRFPQPSGPVSAGVVPTAGLGGCRVGSTLESPSWPTLAVVADVGVVATLVKEGVPPVALRPDTAERAAGEVLSRLRRRFGVLLNTVLRVSVRDRGASPEPCTRGVGQTDSPPLKTVTVDGAEWLWC